MDKRVREEMDPHDLQDLEDMPEINEPLQNKAGVGKKGKKKADGSAEEPEVDPGIDYLRWSD
ncbi:MAG: hypothetical protein GXY86_06835 [Firmicutes bacterium]|nr:hypothetical protein [Bacillota bacterium]